MHTIQVKGLTSDVPHTGEGLTSDVLHTGEGLTSDVHHTGEGGRYHLLTKFEHIFVTVITFSPFLLCRYFYYQLVAYCVCFKMLCEMSL